MAESKEAKDSDRGLTWTHQDDFEKCKRNKTVYEKMTKRLRECGYEITAIQCRTKIESLRNEYFNTKTENGKSGKGRKS